jgi:hypothetical protein
MVMSMTKMVPIPSTRLFATVVVMATAGHNPAMETKTGFSCKIFLPTILIPPTYGRCIVFALIVVFYDRLLAKCDSHCLIYCI